MAANAEEEREAWKVHFEKVSKTRGEVHETVLQSIPKEKRKAKWLGEVPTSTQLDKCVSQMKKRARKEDGFTVKLLKYGGNKMGKRVYEVVPEMCAKAAAAEEGEEVQEWPESWKVGVVVPLWKQNAKRKIRTHGEGSHC